MLHSTVFGRRSHEKAADADLLRKAKKEKELELVREFPIDADIVSDIVLDFLMMNGLYKLTTSACILYWISITNII